MKIYARSQKEFNETMSVYGFTDETVEDDPNNYFISVIGTSFMEPWFKSDHRNVLNLKFDDCLQDMKIIKNKTDKELGDSHARAITVDQAEKIATFAKEIPEGCTILVHCAAGVSRSGAIAKALAEFFDVEMHRFNLDNPQIQENMRVYKFLKAKLENAHSKPTWNGI